MKRAIIAAGLTLLAALTGAAPAQAVPPPAVPVLSTTCDGILYPDTVGSAPGANGRLHGFAGYRHGSCGNRLYYFEGAGSAWTTRATSLFGTVIDVAQDSTGTYLLYVIDELSGTPELAVAKRTPTGTTTRLAIVAPATGVAGGSIIARGGRWLAVWSQRNGTAGDQDLYQYGNLYSSAGTSSPVAVGSGDDRVPTLAFAPDGAVVLAFTRTWSTGRVVRVARTTTGSTWSWRTAGSGLPINTDFPGLDLAVTTSGTFVTWTESTNAISRVVVADDLAGTWRRQQPPVPFDFASWDASLVASGTRVLAGYSNGDEYPTGGAYFTRRATGSGGWTEVPTGPGVPVSIDSAGVVGMSLSGGSVTALVFSGGNLYALNGLTL